MSDDELHDDDGNDATGAAPPPEGDHVCPECGAGFDTPLKLGAHRRMAHGVAGSSKRSQRNRKRSSSGGGGGGGGSSRVDRRRKAVAETLRELVDFRDAARGEGEPEVLAELIRRDADRIAAAVAFIAERFNPLGHGIDLMLGHGGPVTILRGFSGVARWTLRKWKRMLQERNQPLEPEPGFEGDVLPPRYGYDTVSETTFPVT